MSGAADLEISIHRWNRANYAVELRFSLPDSDADSAPVRSLTQFDSVTLRALALDPAAYGRALAGMLLADATAQTAFATARDRACTLQVPLRLRLFIGPSAPDLHDLRWEMLVDPTTGAPLLLGENLLFSRYISSEWRPVRLRTPGTLRALVCIANPSDLDQYQPGGAVTPLAPVNVPEETKQAREGLGTIPVTLLASGTASLDNLFAHLRDGYDILYLVCHGALDEGQTKLWLEGPDGQAAVVGGEEVVTRLDELPPGARPRLIVLAACQTTGGRAADGGALAALGPRLAAVGIPAVIGMSDDVTQATVAAFMSRFFIELARDGQIDRAMAVARGAVRGRPDFWMPTLFLRLRSGRLWFTPGFVDSGPAGEYDRWPALLGYIAARRCTPLLGSGLLEALIGTTREIATRWADKYGFPMAPAQREDLPQVAQYLSVHLEPEFPRSELARYLREMLARNDSEATPEMPLAALLSRAGARLRAADPAEPHNVLATLPFPLYITTNPDNLLADALVAAGKRPQIELCRWIPDPAIEWPPSIYTPPLPDSPPLPPYTPSEHAPLLYYLCGQLGTPYSIVLKEDDYFDYLINVTRDKTLIPQVVNSALVNRSLLFLGFRLEEWDFRVLFRIINGQEGQALRKRYRHVAVQLDPDESRSLAPAAARRYLQEYFNQANISIYWGSVGDFVQELADRWADYVRETGGRPP